MSLWEYKVITSGKGGFATPALLEKFLNDLGRDEWEIIHFHTPPDNFLAFTGLARRTTQRDWTLEDAAAAAAKAEAEKLRAEFEAKFKAASSNAPAAEERSASFLEEKMAPDDGFRKPVDTSHDDEPEAAEDEKDDWDKLTAAEEDELPTFFEAIKPHMRRNQRGPGMSVGVDYLAKKWDQSEDDLKGALLECGFVMPADEDAKAEYIEYDGDLYWLNINRRGELWINTKEKPRPVFRPIKGQKVAVEEEAPKGEARAKDGGRSETDRASAPESAPASDGTSAAGEGGAGKSEGGRPSVPLPEGPALLEKIRPHMRRNRRGPGGSGSMTFLSRALRTNEAELKQAIAALGLTLPATPADKPVYAEIGDELWWLNLDSRGGLWINGREKKAGETAASANEAGASENAPASDPTAASTAGTGGEASPGTEAASAAGTTAADPATNAAPAAAQVSDSPAAPAAAEAAAGPARGVSESAVSSGAGDAANPALAGARLLLKETRSGGFAAKVDRLAEETGKSADDFLVTLVAAGLKVPEKPREKPVFVPLASEVLWLNRNAKGELWLNAKPSKFADQQEDAEDEGEDEGGGSADEGDAEKKPRRGRLSRGRSR